MTKKRFMFAPHSETQHGLAKSHSTRGARLFLAMMIIYGGISGMFQGPARQGPVAQFAARVSQEWQDWISHAPANLP